MNVSLQLRERVARPRYRHAGGVTAVEEQGEFQTHAEVLSSFRKVEVLGISFRKTGVASAARLRWIGIRRR